MRLCETEGYTDNHLESAKVRTLLGLAVPVRWLMVALVVDAGVIGTDG